MVLVFSVVMMMNVAGSREGGRGAETRRDERRCGKTRNKNTRRIASIYEEAVRARAVRRCARPRTLACAYVQRPHRCSQHTLGCITRRDLYSRLTSLCEGRIRSDTSLVCTHDSSVRLPPIFSLSISPPRSFSPSPPPLAFSGLVRSSFVRWFRCDGLYPVLSTLPSSPRLHERTQLDGSNWTANDRAVIRINTLLHPFLPPRERPARFSTRRYDA